MSEDNLSPWDLMSPVTKVQEYDSQLEKAKVLYNNCTLEKCHSSEHGITREIDLGDSRFYLLHEPNGLDKQKEYPLLLFFHGIYGYCWNFALNKTKYMEHANKQKFILVFMQARGLHSPFRMHNQIRYGDSRWEFKLDEDYKYTDEVIEDVQKYFKIDHKRIYCCGQSMGGLFSCALAAVHSKKFAAICSTMGGWPTTVFSTDLVKDSTFSVPLLLVTGTEDSHLEYTLTAKGVFEKNGYPVEYICIEDWGHTYPVQKEQEILSFLMRHTL